MDNTRTWTYAGAYSCSMAAVAESVFGKFCMFVLNWEVLNGDGVDGVGGIFPFFCFFFFLRFAFFFVFLWFSFVFFCFSSLFFVFLCFFLPILLEQGQTTAIYWESGEFHSDPVCTDPVQNFPIEASKNFSASTSLSLLMQVPVSRLACS